MNNRVLPTNKCQIYKIYHIRSTVVGCIHKTAIHLRLNLLLLLVDQTCLVNPRTTSAIGRRMIRRSPRISFWRIQRPMNNSTEKCPCFCTEVYPFGLQGCTPSDCSRKSNAKWRGTAPEVWGGHPKQSTEADQSDDALVDCCSSNRYGSMHGVRFDRLHLWFHKSGYSWHGNKKGGLIYCHWIFGWFTGCMQQKCARSAARVSGRSHSTTCLDPEINCYSIFDREIKCYSMYTMYYLSSEVENGFASWTPISLYSSHLTLPLPLDDEGIPVTMLGCHPNHNPCYCRMHSWDSTAICNLLFSFSSIFSRSQFNTT